MPNVSIRPLSDLPAALPVLASAMSMSRASMVIDQLKSLVGQSRTDEIVFVTCEQANSNGTDGAANQAGVVVFHPANADFATMFVAGWLERWPVDHRVDAYDQQRIRSTARSINDVLEPLLYQRGVRFMQYATDVVDAESKKSRLSDDVNSYWPIGLGYQHVGDLEYQSGSTEKMIELLGRHEPSQVELRRVTEVAEFAKVVELTYEQTMDCPAMSNLRTAQETLCGYRYTDAFDPTLWFSVHRLSDSVPDSNLPIGCLILGIHKNHHAPLDQDGVADAPTMSVISELVYMGLIPEARGLGLGKEVLQHAALVSQKLVAQRMILAVDESNHPARDLYRRVGMVPLMRESVWAKRLGFGDEN